MKRRGFAEDSVMNIILWILILILAGFSVYLLFKRFGLR